MDQPTEQDITIWQSLKAGNKLAFNHLFRSYYSELFYYGLKISANPDFVKECIQEVFIRIWETRERLGNVENPKVYLLVSLRRRMLTQIKKITSLPVTDLDQLDHTAFLFEENEFEKHETISEEVRQILLDAVNALTKKQRELILLYFYHGLSYQEIAAIMDISIQAARNLMYRTLTHLKEIIGNTDLKSMLFLLFTLSVPEPFSN